VHTTHYLGADLGSKFFYKVAEMSEEAKLLSKGMAKYRLRAQPERSQLFSVYSQVSNCSIAISITPFSGEDREVEGGLAVSQGGHAQAVVVRMKETTLTGFVHLTAANGELRESEHGLDELGAAGTDVDMIVRDRQIQAIADRVGKVKSARPLIEIEPGQVRSLASVAYNRLLRDDFSRSVHKGDEIEALQRNTRIVSEIGLFVLFRTDGSSCCSCSCSCWGSSSCSSSYS
jgi:hypothetical protein